MGDVVDPMMTGSKDPLILRNYRVIFPSTTRYYNLHSSALKYPGQHTHTRDLDLHFQVGAAPVVLPYESELVITVYIEVNTEGVRADQARVGGQLVQNNEDRQNAQAAMVESMLKTFVTNEWTPVPLYRVKAKSVSHCVKFTNATIANMTFQSYRTPIFLNEIMLRKPFHQQQKYPDNYTGEKSVYYNQDFQTVLDDKIGFFLRPLTRGMPNENPLMYMTPQLSSDAKLVSLTFRIPFTELLPVFKIGVIPLITVPNSTMDLDIGIYNPALWLYPNKALFGDFAYLEAHLNITTVSHPNVNPLANALIQPRMNGNTFVAAYLDYLSFDQHFELSRGSTEFFFNITQALKNVPFFSLSFVDETVYPGNAYQRLDLASSARGIDLRFQPTNDPLSNVSAAGIAGFNRERLLATLESGYPSQISIIPPERERGGFFSLPPEIYCDELDVRLGEATYPFTQLPMSWPDMYMYNRKHFEMYGRDFNTNRISPLGRAYTGDASFFFDLSHSPMAGFEVSGDSPLQIRGVLKNPKYPQITDYVGERDPMVVHPRIHVILTLYYTNKFIVMLDTGGVLPLQ